MKSSKFCWKYFLLITIELIITTSILDILAAYSLKLLLIGNKYSIFGRDPEVEKYLKLLNIWRNGSFIWKKPLFPKTRLQNMGGKKLKATSFDYAPFIYKENSIYYGFEVRYIRYMVYRITISNTLLNTN